MTKCARTACDSPEAICEHSQTGLMYCVSCARRINEHNPGLVAIPTARTDRQAEHELDEPVRLDRLSKKAKNWLAEQNALDVLFGPIDMDTRKRTEKQCYFSPRALARSCGWNPSSFEDVLARLQVKGKITLVYLADGSAHAKLLAP